MGLRPDARDPNVKPGTDFFLNALGNWLKRTRYSRRPRRRSASTSNWPILTEAAVRQLIEDAAAGRSDRSRRRQDRRRLQAPSWTRRVSKQLDAKPLAADLAAIRAEKTKEDVVALMGRRTHGFQAEPSSAAIIPADDKDAEPYAVSHGHRRHRPARPRLLSDATSSPTRRPSIRPTWRTMLGMIGWSDPQASAKAVVDFETKLAEASWTRVEQRDPDKHLQSDDGGGAFRLCAGLQLPRHSSTEPVCAAVGPA